jgi:hypothetical protein
MRAETLVAIKNVPWMSTKIASGRTGTAIPASNLPQGGYWFTPDDMTEDEDGICRNYGFHYQEDELGFIDDPTMTHRII